MSDTAFARLPEPPYYAVIFSSRRTSGDAGYAQMAARMMELAAGLSGRGKRASRCRLG